MLSPSDVNEVNFVCVWSPIELAKQTSQVEGRHEVQVLQGENIATERRRRKRSGEW